MNNSYRDLLIPVFGESVTDEYLKAINSIPVNENVYCEIHHILPESIFPEYRKDKDNLIRIPAFEHYKLHFILAKSDNPKMVFAFNMMKRILPLLEDEHDLQLCAEMYQIHRERISKWLSTINTGRMHSDASKRKMSERMSGHLFAIDKETNQPVFITTEEYATNREKYKHPRDGRKHSEETINKIINNSIKGKVAFVHKETNKIIYRDESFENPEYTKGGYRNQWSVDNFTDSKYWYNSETEECIRSKESPGTQWINKRVGFNNYFTNNVRVICLKTGEIRYIEKGTNKPTEIAPNKKAFVDSKNRILYVHESIPELKDYSNIKPDSVGRYINGKYHQISNIRKELFDSLQLGNKYQYLKVSDIDYSRQWEIK